MISLRNVTKSFSIEQTSIPVLKQIDFDVSEGQSLAILGRSGSGKSTLLSLLAGLDVPDAGEILIDGQELSSLSSKQRTHFRGKNIGIVFQQFHLMKSLSALENVSLPLLIQGRGLKEANLLAEELLDKVGLKDRLHHSPQKLSGGESQRVAIARALIVKPKLLLADEPSGSLDVETGDKILKLFFELTRSEKSTMIFVTHSVNLAQACNRQLYLDAGVLSEKN